MFGYSTSISQDTYRLGTVIRSHSSARFCFELSGNLNYKIICNLNFAKNFKLEISFELKLWIRNFFELKLWIRNYFALKHLI